MTRWLRIPLAVAIIIAAVLLVILAAGGANSVIFERYFPILLIVDSFATIALLSSTVCLNSAATKFLALA